jgi:uncharacterized membrane protein YsdA (DUF1294 family)
MSTDLILIVVVLYLILNLISFLLYYVDKRKAVKGRYRISESALITAGLIGPVGALAGMKVFRHKTQKTKFKLIYLFLMIHLVLIAFIVWKFLL